MFCPDSLLAVKDTSKNGRDGSIRSIRKVCMGDLFSSSAARKLL